MPSAFTFTPANSPTGQAVPCDVLYSASSSGALPLTVPGTACGDHSGLQRSSGSTIDNLAIDRVDKGVDYSSMSSDGQLAGERLYRWDGWIYVPIQDSYVFRIQHSTALADANVRFTLDNSQKTLVDSGSFYHGSWYGSMSVIVSPTNAGYIEKGLRNLQCALPEEKKGRSQVPLVRCSEHPSVGWHKVTLTVDATDIPANSQLSFRFATSRAICSPAETSSAKRSHHRGLFRYSPSTGTTPQTASQRNHSNEFAPKLRSVNCSRLRAFRAGRATGVFGENSTRLPSRVVATGFRSPSLKFKLERPCIFHFLRSHPAITEKSARRK